MAGQMGQSTPKFVQLKQDEVVAMRGQFLGYIRDLEQLRSQSILINAVNDEKRTYISISESGYPLLLPNSFQDMKKDELENTLRDYLTKHYSEYQCP
jgi:hypothetical protein